MSNSLSLTGEGEGQAPGALDGTERRGLLDLTFVPQGIFLGQSWHPERSLPGALSLAVARREAGTGASGRGEGWW